MLFSADADADIYIAATRFHYAATPLPLLF